MEEALGSRKSLYALVLFVETLVFVMLPFLFRGAANKDWVQEAIKYSNCFAGGIFTVAGLTHLLPHVLEAEEEAGYGHHSGSFPIGPTVVALTFYAVLALDRISGGHGHSHDDEPKEMQEVGHSVIELTNLAPPDQRATGRSAPGVQLEKKPFYVYAPLLTMLTVHSFFDGTALGILKEPQAAQGIFLAIAFHKFAEAFVVGVKLSRCATPTGYLIFGALCFSFVTPLGVATGTEVGALFEDALVECMIGAVACGTFLYVGMTEVVEDLDNGAVPRKVGAMISGALLMCCVNLVSAWLSVDHHHHDDHDHHDLHQIHHA
jgi:zinc transporter 1/2/3